VVVGIKRQLEVGKKAVVVGGERQFEVGGNVSNIVVVVGGRRRSSALLPPPSGDPPARRVQAAFALATIVGLPSHELPCLHHHSSLFSSVPVPVPELSVPEPELPEES
jgi:hypothetical protein